MEDSKKEMAYIFAKHKAEKLKRFYVHGLVFLAFNTILIFVKVTRNMNNGETFNEAFIDISTLATPVIWGLILAIHAFSVFGPNVILGYDWEQKKLKQYMQEEEEQFNNQKK